MASPTLEVRLASLKVSISDMSEEEVTSLVRKSRENRQPIPKEVQEEKRERKRTDTLLSKMSPEQAQALLDKITANIE